MTAVMTQVPVPTATTDKENRINMKKTFIIALLALVALAGQAQEIRTIEPTLNDYLPLLKAQGYMVYSFDTKDFNGGITGSVLLITFEVSVTQRGLALLCPVAGTV